MPMPWIVRHGIEIPTSESPLTTRFAWVLSKSGSGSFYRALLVSWTRSHLLPIFRRNFAASLLTLSWRSLLGPSLPRISGVLLSGLL